MDEKKHGEITVDIHLPSTILFEGLRWVVRYQFTLIRVVFFYFLGGERLFKLLYVREIGEAEGGGEEGEERKEGRRRREGGEREEREEEKRG